jgi:hypothetical protein
MNSKESLIFRCTDLIKKFKCDVVAIHSNLKDGFESLIRFMTYEDVMNLRSLYALVEPVNNKYIKEAYNLRNSVSKLFVGNVQAFEDKFKKLYEEEV